MLLTILCLYIRIVKSGHTCHEAVAQPNCYNNVNDKIPCAMCFPGGPFTEGMGCSDGSTPKPECLNGCLPDTFPTISTTSYIYD